MQGDLKRVFSDAPEREKSDQEALSVNYDGCRYSCPSNRLNVTDHSVICKNQAQKISAGAANSLGFCSTRLYSINALFC